MRNHVLFHLSLEMTWYVLSIHEWVTYIYIFLNFIFPRSITGSITIPLGLPDFFKGWNQWQPIFQQYPPFALMETLSWNTSTLIAWKFICASLFSPCDHLSLCLYTYDLSLCFPTSSHTLLLWNQWKGINFLGDTPPICKLWIILLNFSLPSVSSCKSMIYIKIIQNFLIPSFYRRYSKVSLGRGLVKMYAIFYFVPMYSKLIFFSVTCSRRKWYLSGMCFVLECITGFFEILIVLVWSQNIRMGS
jgi:hypothetical protein